jgi:hypothetical protein
MATVLEGLRLPNAWNLWQREDKKGEARTELLLMMDVMLWDTKPLPRSSLITSTLLRSLTSIFFYQYSTLCLRVRIWNREEIQVLLYARFKNKAEMNSGYDICYS